MQIVVAVESLGKHLGATILGNTEVRWHLQLIYPVSQGGNSISSKKIQMEKSYTN